MSPILAAPLDVASRLAAPTAFSRLPCRYPLRSSVLSRYRLNMSFSIQTLRKGLTPSTRLASSPNTEPPLKDIGKQLSEIDSEKLIKDVKDKWEGVEDKTTFIIYVGAAVLVLFLGSSVVSAFDKLPLLPKLFQLVGLVYTAWFIYRYLLFKSSRQELISDVEELKKKISGGQ